MTSTFTTPIPAFRRPPAAETLRIATGERVTCCTLASSLVREHCVYARVLNEIGRRQFALD
jgi:hypothetical protein